MHAVIDLEEEEVLARQEEEDASLALALALQEQQQPSLAPLLPRKRPRDSQNPPHPGQPPAPPSLPSSPPPSRLHVASHSSSTLHAITQRLQRFSPSLCADPICTARQKDTWTCGYENLASLLRSIGLRGTQPVPSDLNPAALQRIIEQAWSAGFSRSDRTKLVGTKKWIGGAPASCVTLRGQ